MKSEECEFKLHLRIFCQTYKSVNTLATAVLLNKVKKIVSFLRSNGTTIHVFTHFQIINLQKGKKKKTQIDL